METNILQKLNELKDAFTYEGEQHVFSESCPEKIQNLFCDAGLEIDDYQFRWADFIMEACMSELFTFSEWDQSVVEERLQDIQHDVCDGLVDVYNTNLTAWLASSLKRLEYVDDVYQECRDADSGDIVTILSCGQYDEIAEVFTMVQNVIVSYLFENE